MRSIYLRHIEFVIILLMILFSISRKCFSQSHNCPKYLIIESKKFKTWQDEIKRIAVSQGNKIKFCENNSNKKIIGKIDTISDSSFTVNGKKYFAINIKKLKIMGRKGRIITIVGSTTFVLSTILCLGSDDIFPPKYDQAGDNLNQFNHDVFQGCTGCFAFAGGVTTLVGLYEIAKPKYYFFNKNWKLYVQ